MKNKKLQAVISAHGEALIRWFKLPANTDPLKLCKQLQKIQLSAQTLAKNYNPEIEPMTKQMFNKIMHNLYQQAQTLLGPDILLDPDTGTLLIDECYIGLEDSGIVRDENGYGLVAPRFSTSG